jgi:hypothetical protein
MASCLVQEDGDPLLHCEGEVTSWSGNLCFIFLDIKFFIKQGNPCQVNDLFMMTC